MRCPQCAQEVRQYLSLLIAALIERRATIADKGKNDLGLRQLRADKARNLRKWLSNYRFA